MKLLYVSSCHPTLEYNDLTLFSEMGIECFSTGIYANPLRPVKSMLWRGESVPNLKLDKDALTKFINVNKHYHKNLIGYRRPQLVIPKNLVDMFDVVICNSFHFYVDINWNNIKHKPVIWRTYGDSTPQTEKRMQDKVKEGLKIVRGSKNELKKPDCAGGTVIRCHLDEKFYSGWQGTDRSVLSFHNAFCLRKEEKAAQEYVKLRASMTEKFNLFGDHHKDHDLVQGFLSNEDQLRQYQNSQVYFSIGSHPAPVTFNFMEALTVGIPVVTFGYGIGGAPNNHGKPSYYEVPEFIQHGVNGFFSDDIKEISGIIKELLDNEDLRKTISKNGRESAISYWGKESVKAEWTKYFKANGLMK